MARVILHIDLDAFFVNAEILRRPELLGKPVVVGHDSKRSIVSTASYEARKYGIFSGGSIFNAKKLCPDLIIVDTDFDYINKLSNKFFETIEQFSDKIEILGCDECYVDITDNTKEYEQYIQSIQSEIHQNVGLTCSIGVASNKFLAKMATDLKKPNSINILRKKDISKYLFPLPIGKMYMVGKKTEKRLLELGIDTIGKLAEVDSAIMIEQLGNYAKELILRANGIDNDQVETQTFNRKSISSARTLNEDTDDIDVLLKELDERIIDVLNQLKKEKLIGNVISVNIKTHDFKVFRKQSANPLPLDDYYIISSQATQLLKDLIEDKTIRLIGFGISGLEIDDNIKIV